MKTYTHSVRSLTRTVYDDLTRTVYEDLTRTVYEDLRHSSSSGPVANARMYCSLKAYCTTLSPLGLVVPTFSARCLHARNNARDPSSERWNCVGEKVPEFCLNGDFHAI